MRKRLRRRRLSGCSCPPPPCALACWARRSQTERPPRCSPRCSCHRVFAFAWRRLADCCGCCSWLRGGVRESEESCDRSRFEASGLAAAATRGVDGGARAARVCCRCFDSLLWVTGRRGGRRREQARAEVGRGNSATNTQQQEQSCSSLNLRAERTIRSPRNSQLLQLSSVKVWAS